MISFPVPGFESFLFLTTFTVLSGREQFLCVCACYVSSHSKLHSNYIEPFRDVSVCVMCAYIVCNPIHSEHTQPIAVFVIFVVYIKL